METCARGFSYMPEKLEVNLQYIEDRELDRVWKASRRQRAKDQEQRIWEDFVKEKDIVHSACTEDPYQFLHELPEHCLKELMEAELHKMRSESEEPIVEQPNQVEAEHSHEKQACHNVTFVENDKGSDHDMFHIFDDDNDFNQSDVEGEDDQPESPSTVRERASVDDTPDVAAVKSTETVSNFIESSIHCARVKDMRIKIGQEMIHMMASLEAQNVMSLEGSEVSRRCRRAAEFCARFNRIYMYQLQRQAHNIKRHVGQSLPLAQHTQFQSQMLRVVSLHQNILQALQVFHKSFPATMCLRECGRALRHACAFVRDASALYRAVPPPDHFPAAYDLYDDELLQTCDKLDDAVNEYDLRVADFLSSTDLPSVPVSATPSSSSSKSGKNKPKRNPFCKTGHKAISAKDADGRLSMYSLDTLRINLHPKSTGSRDHSSGAGRGRPSPSVVSSAKHQLTDKGQDINTKKLARRPLMRAPNSGHARPRHAKDMEIATMVEAVETCMSPQVGSQCGSPRSPARRSPRQQNLHVTRKPSPHRKQSPSRRTHVPSPRAKARRVATSPKQPQTKKSLSSIKSETLIAPVTQIQCAQRLPGSGRNTDRSLIKKLGNSGNITDRSIHSEKNGHTERYSDRSERSRNSERCSIAKNVERSTHTDLSRKSENNESPNDGKGKGDRVVKDTVGGKKQQLVGRDADKEFCGVKELTDNKDSRSYAKEVEKEKSDRSRAGSSTSRCDVSWLLRQLCSGDPSGLNEEKATGAKNAQLLCVRGGTTPGQPTTPQLLRILEETIQKQAPKPMYDAQKPKNPEQFRLNFNIGETTANRLFQYRTKFVQHMLTSPLYANSAVGKPWEMIGSVSDKIIDELLTGVAKEMEIKEVLRDMYKYETK